MGLAFSFVIMFFLFFYGLHWNNLCFQILEMKQNIFKSSLVVCLLLLSTLTKVIGIQEVLHDHEHQHQDNHSHNSFSGLYKHINLDCSHSNDHDELPAEQDSKENCNLCDKILLDNLKAFEGIDVYKSEGEQQNFQKKTIIKYRSETIKKRLSTALFSRPPPIFT